MDQAANWWVVAESSLGKISDDIRSIQADRRINLRLKKIRDDCDVIKGKYLEYKSEVRSL